MVPTEQKQVILLNNIETKIYLQTKLRNLKRKHAKLAHHADFADEYFSIGKEIEDVEAQITNLQ